MNINFLLIENFFLFNPVLKMKLCMIYGELEELTDGKRGLIEVNVVNENGIK